ncbi:MAG: T9SS type A sorting domain-containing protein, partial [candidate division KSB1 bacterium]
GLGARARLDSLLVFWPSGIKEKYVALAANQFLKIREGEGIVTSVTQPRAPQTAPEDFVLLQNYPNPFSAQSATAIRYATSVSGEVTLKVFDVLGRNLATLALGMRQAGHHEFKFEATALRSGIYFYRLEMAATAKNNFAATRYGKMIVTR